MPPLSILYALLSAFTWASSDALAKRLLARGVGEAFILWVRHLAALPFLLPFLVLQPWPALDQTFWLLHLVWLPLETVALFLYIRAIRLSPLSLTLPFLSLTPLFLLPLGAIALGEIPSLGAGLGVGVVVLGSYFLGIERESRDPLAPFRRIHREPGAQLMIWVAFLYSITSVAGKLLILHSAPLFFSAYYGVIMTLVLTPFAWAEGRSKHWLAPSLWLAGLAWAGSIVTHMLALAIAPVAYMIAIKRLMGVFGVLYGWWFFGEGAVVWRLVGSLIMVGGALLIGLPR